jgi:hypothetical protein
MLHRNAKAVIGLATAFAIAAAIISGDVSPNPWMNRPPEQSTGTEPFAL